ncbi:peptidase S8 [Arthrobacter sp. MYb227]|nr:S8 family serine peptidase [Arthrobacter sp. MYb227]PQZ91708.1 peptidase S8 [Arthrobacter sp. MYb227]
MLSLGLCAAFVFAGAPSANADAARDSQWWLESSGITKVWEVSKGKGVKVAVIDTGIDTSHPDLAGAVVGGKDVSGSGKADGSEPLGNRPEHGTLVATLLAGRGNNASAISEARAEADIQKNAYEDALKSAEEAEEPPPPSPDPIAVPKPGPGPDGVIGVAPEAELLSISLWMGTENPAGISIEEQIPRAVIWAVDQGAKVINMSLGSTRPEWPVSWDRAFKYAEDHDVVVVAAAGNRAGGMSQVGAPATIPGVLTVAGIDRDGKASVDSSTEGISIGVAAPAEPLVGGLPGGGYADWAGTSGAAPLVSGVAAMIRSKYPHMKAPEVINRILVTARDAGKPGVDNLYGHGILDANAALTAPVPHVAANPMNTIAEWIRVHRRSDTPSAEPSLDPGISREKSTIEPIAAPKPQTPSDDDAFLPPLLVLGFGSLLVLTMAGGTLHFVRSSRAKQRADTAVAGSVASLKLAEHASSRDIFDDMPESKIDR